MELAKSIVENTQGDFDLLTCCIGFGILHAKTMVIDGNLAPRPGKCIQSCIHLVNEDTTSKEERKGGERKASVPLPFFITAHL